MPPENGEDATLEDVEDAAEAELEDDSGDADEFSPFEELSEEYSPSQITSVQGPDGLPMQVAPGAGETDIPVFSCETLVCMGDYSKFVDAEGKTYDKLLVEQRYPYFVLKGSGTEVTPIRPPCRHYVRQMTQFEHNPEVKLISRLCSARRDRQGAFMSVRDRAVWACDMRDPPDLESTKLLDAFDNKKVKEGQERTFNSIFGKVSE
jgi:hypothetical protein